jgi:hypothetical protein
VVKKERIGCALDSAGYIEVGDSSEQGKDVQLPTQRAKIFRQMSDHLLLLQESIPRSLKEVDLYDTVGPM